MKIWIDGDACPAVIKEIIYKAARRTGLTVTLVANRHLRVPECTNIHFLRVGAGMDVADREIVKRLEPGDLVITADIPLAADVVAKGGLALDPRGECYRSDNIRERLSMRDFMDELRSSGVETGGPRPLQASDKAAFANGLDRLLAKHGRLNQ